MVVNTWIAYCRLEPWGREWEQSAMIAQQLAAVRHSVALSRSVDDAKQLDDTLDRNRYMPGEYSQPKPPTKPLDGEQLKSHFEALAASHRRR
jgi:hypothetical protein